MQSRARTAVAWLAVLVLGVVIAAGAQQTVEIQQIVNIQPVTQQIHATHGTIDWTNGVIEAAGTGAPPTTAGFSDAQRRLMARRAAVIEAQRNLAETINGVHLTSYSTVQNFVLQDDTIRTTLEAFIQGARVVNERPLADGSYEVVVRLGMYGPASLSKAVVPAMITQEKKMQMGGGLPAPIMTIPAPSAPAVGASESSEPTGEVAGAQLPVGPVTGIVVDCRGLKIAPAMSPKIMDESGREIWGTMQIDPEVAIDFGIVAYFQTVDAARASTRAGNNPLIVNAIGTSGISKDYPANAVVTVGDGDLIRTENEKTRFLEKLRVCFVIDEQ